MEKETIQVEEIPANPYEGVNMGRNIKYARKFKNVYQKELAEALNLHPRQMSRIEEKEIIKDEELLNKIANYLQCDVNFLKYNKMEEVMKSYNITDPVNNPVVNSAENSHDEVQQEQDNVNGVKIGEDQNNISGGRQENYYITNNNCSIDELKDVFLKVLEKKDENTAELRNEIEELKKTIEQIKERK